MQVPTPRPTPVTRALAALAAAAEAGDLGAVDALLARLLELHPAGEPPPTGMAELLSYRGFKPAELAMMSGGLKPIVKMEDLPTDDADAFQARYGNRYHIVRGPLYAKDALGLRSVPVTAGREVLVSLYVSRDEGGAALLRHEREHRDDVRGAGRMLGFPPCCVDAFAADVARSRGADDTLNDDACRRVLRTAMATPGDARLNPLSNLELLGFYPCDTHCPAAIAHADRVLAVLERRRPGAAAATLQRLRGTYLYFRIPFFARVEGERRGEVVGIERIVVNRFPHHPARVAQGRFAALLGHALGGADGLVNDQGAVVCLKGGGRARLGRNDAQGPMLVSFH